MYFLETDKFGPNPHPTRTHHTKFPVPSPGHSTTVPWRVIFYLFNFFLKNFPIRVTIKSVGLYSLVLAVLCFLAFFKSVHCLLIFMKNFFNNKIIFTWFRTINPSWDYWKPSWHLSHPDVTNIPSSPIGDPKSGKMFRCEETKQQRGTFPLQMSCVNYSFSLLSPFLNPKKYLVMPWALLGVLRKESQ